MSERDIFIAALHRRDPAERAAFLERACGGDHALRAQVEELLREEERLGSFLERPAEGPAGAGTVPPAAGACGEGAGTVIGPYRLVQQIGEGGMGTVFLAQQAAPVKRLVAMKVIKPGMDSKEVLARFEAERQALALMDHPNIATVHEAGTTERGHPYFVMELVKGVPITRYCDERHLTPRERLELMVPVCQAVQHAHTKGVIHRDLKPSNVLVALYDGRPVPKVIDFGVAKAAGQQLTDKTLVTEFGAVVGTLEYMSPEQAQLNQLDIDTRSDVYTLGVLLYELLTGSTPLGRERCREGGLLEALRLIREEEPTRPSARLSTTRELPAIAANRGLEPRKLSGALRGELDWIVLKALEKERSRRYETASGLAADLQRYLEDEPVEACPPSAAYRFGKFARRHKVGLAIAGLVLLFIVLLGCGLGWAIRDRAARKQEEARKLTLTEQGIRQALDRTTRYRGELQSLLRKRGGVQDLLNQAARWELLIRTAQAELEQARRLTARAEGAVDAELTRALDELGERLTADDDDRLLALRLETIRLDRATWVGHSFDNRRGAEEYPRALTGFGVLNDEPAAVAARLRASPIREQLVAAVDDWAFVAFGLGERGVAVRLLAVAQLAAPDPAWGDRLRRLKVWRDPEALGKLVAEAPVAGLSPQMLGLVGIRLRGSAAEESWLRRAQAQYPGDFWLNVYLANAIRETNPVEACGYYRVAAAVRPTSGAAYNNLGGTLADQGKLPEAIAAYRKAIDIDPRFAYPHYNLGVVLREQGDLPEAIAAYRKAVEIDPKLACAYYNLGGVLHDQRKLPEAVAAYRKAIELKPGYPEALCNLGQALKLQGQFTEALKALELGHELGSRTPGWRYRSAAWVEHCKSLVALDQKLPAVLRGEAAPAAEQLALADLCRRYKRHYRAAVTLFGRAFAAQPGLAEELPKGSRYNAACAAALAGTGQGQDAGTLPDAERARLRRQALGWLLADLTAWSGRMEREPDRARATVATQMRHWQRDADFQAVRDAAALARLPGEEQRQWRALWEQVAALLARADGAR
jgi:serine/threonine protein kinase/tetratricopeptide (TPR) repeat protein